MNRLLNDERYLNQNRNNLFDKLLYQDENNCDEDFSKEDHAPNPEIFLGTNGSQTTISLIYNRKLVEKVFDEEKNDHPDNNYLDQTLHHYDSFDSDKEAIVLLLKI